jgi:hypothetical protein
VAHPLTACIQTRYKEKSTATEARSGSTVDKSPLHLKPPLIRTTICLRLRMSIFKEMHELRTVGSPNDCRELLRKLAIAISRGWVEQIPVMKPHPMAPNETWYRDKETGQIYSLHPFDERPGLWMEVDLNDLIEPG